MIEDSSKSRLPEALQGDELSRRRVVPATSSPATSRQRRLLRRRVVGDELTGSVQEPETVQDQSPVVDNTDESVSSAVSRVESTEAASPIAEEAAEIVMEVPQSDPSAPPVEVDTLANPLPQPCDNLDVPSSAPNVAANIPSLREIAISIEEDMLRIPDDEDMATSSGNSISMEVQLTTNNRLACIFGIYRRYFNLRRLLDLLVRCGCQKRKAACIAICLTICFTVCSITVAASKLPISGLFVSSIRLYLLLTLLFLIFSFADFR